jgi:hypothetical protein
MGRSERNTTQLLIITIIGIILGLGAVAIGLSAQATRNANEGIFPFTNSLDEDVQTNITYMESNNTAQLNTLAQLTQQALALTVVGSPPNRTLVSSGYARLYPATLAVLPPPLSIDYGALEGYPNTTWQLYSSELDFGFIIYVLHIDPVISDNIVFENVIPLPSTSFNSVFIVLDTTNVFPDSGLGVTIVSPFYIPNPFTVTGCSVPSECLVHPTTLAYFRNPETSSAYTIIQVVFSAIVPLPGGVNVTFTPNAMTYIKIS